MPKGKRPPIFLDTSIHIARLVHGPQTKARIEQRLKEHAQTVTGLVCRQELKRRLLQEADYLLRLLHQYNSFDEVQQHLIRNPTRWPKEARKKNICLQTLAQVHEGTDKERTERLRLYLRSLLVLGLKRFDQKVDTVRQDSACGCAKAEVREKVAFQKYDLGEKRCSRLPAGACGVVAFLAARKDVSSQILARLRALPAAEKSAELKNAEAFLEWLAKKPDDAQSEDPCLTVGDLLIALESTGVPNFYTLNGVESQHLCRALEQTLVVCPIDPRKAEVVCEKGAENWPVFGKGYASGAGEKRTAEDADSGA